MIVLLIWISFSFRKILFLSTIFVSAYSDLKCCPSVLHAPVVPLLPHNSRNSSLFTANYKILHQLDIFLLLTVCVQIVDNIWKHVIFQKKFLLFYIKSYLFSCVQRFASAFDIDFPTMFNLFGSFNVLFLCICFLIYIYIYVCVFVIALVICVCVLSLYITNWLLNLKINNQELN